MRFVNCFVLAAFAFGAASAASAQTATTGYGSASVQTVRACPANPASPCPGTGLILQNMTGGAGIANAETFEAGANGRAETQVAFGGLGLPEIKLSSYSGSTTRLGNSVFAYQTYTYTGQDDFDLLLNGAFHIVDSSGVADGTLPGGVFGFAGFAIWDKDRFFDESQVSPFINARAIINQGYLFGQGSGCGDFEGGFGPRAISYSGGALSGGANQSIGVSQQNCFGEETLTLSEGDEFVIASFAQLMTNRGGWADAMGTFTIGLDPSIPIDQQQAFAASVSFEAPAAVPEPATWAMMLVGFGVTGAGLRRARKVRAAIA